MKPGSCRVFLSSGEVLPCSLARLAKVMEWSPWKSSLIKSKVVSGEKSSVRALVSRPCTASSMASLCGTGGCSGCKFGSASRASSGLVMTPPSGCIEICTADSVIAWPDSRMSMTRRCKSFPDGSFSHLKVRLVLRTLPVWSHFHLAAAKIDRSKNILGSFSP
jgi:hypothetical protein